MSIAGFLIYHINFADHLPIIFDFITKCKTPYIFKNSAYNHSFIFAEMFIFILFMLLIEIELTLYKNNFLI